MGEPDDTFGRRSLLEWAAASAALAACARAPTREIVPYVTQPPEVTPGRPLHYATAWEIDGYAMGLVVEANEGRPTKVEGNPKHPASLGATRAIDQALIETLYDPDRATHVRAALEPAAIDGFVNAFSGGRVGVLLEPTSSRAVGALAARVRAERPGSDVFFWSPLARTNAWRASTLATGHAAETLLGRARSLLAIESDFLASGPSCVRDARALADRRAAEGARLWALESRRTATGIYADERLAATAAVRARLACGIAAAVLADPAARASDAARALGARLGARAGEASAWASACARDLLAARGGAAWIIGDDEPMELHALAWLVHAALGSIGEAARVVPSPVVEAGGPSFDLAAFEARLGALDAVIVCGANPVYCAPNRLALTAAKRSAYAGLHENETSRGRGWFVPLAHPLESWADLRADDGTVSIAQPLIEPIFGGLTVAELLARLVGDGSSARDLTRRAVGLSEADFSDALAAGVVGGPAAPLERVDEAALLRAIDAWDLPRARPLELALHASHATLDGRFATPMLLELPEPVTKLTWGNAAVITPETAKALGAVDGDVVRVSTGAAAVELPVLVEAGTAPGVVAIALGWGRRGVGANAFPLRGASGASLAKTGASEPLARTQTAFHLDARASDIVRARHRADPPLHDDVRPRLSLYATRISPTAPHAWAMAIDLSRCTGCGACIAACQAENNVPSVGKHGVVEGRVMHWLRIDRYESEHGAIFQPMLCQHCDDAPCEYVCPVNATVHSPDGLNEMIYNRCVGTRFCSNNCPYKVRRFNWFDYHEDEPALRQLEHNPQVTVRARGVMEKCTFCVQRIREAEHRAIVEHRELRRDEVVSACQQSCATRAIVFGDANDAGSELRRAWARPEAYQVLGDLGTRPRIRYFPKIVDPSPELP